MKKHVVASLRVLDNPGGKGYMEGPPFSKIRTTQKPFELIETKGIILTKVWCFIKVITTKVMFCLFLSKTNCLYYRVRQWNGMSKRNS